MYAIHFLQGECTLGDAVRCVVESAVSKAHAQAGEDLGLDECEVFVTAHAKKIPGGGMLVGFSYDQMGVYLFVNAGLIEQKVVSDRSSVEHDVLDHLYRSLYATARARHMNLDADCDPLEEIVGEGLSELFVIEKTSAPPKERYAQFSDAEIGRLWKKMSSDLDSAHPDIEKWFRGDTVEGLSPFAACSVGFAIAGAYLEETKKNSVGALTVSARNITILQNRY